jgi:predicted permease
MLKTWVRGWRRNRQLSVQFAITIALGMGAAVAVVSLMLALGYQPLPFRDGGRLVAVWEQVKGGAPVAGISGPDLEDFVQDTGGAFSSLGGFTLIKLWLRDHGSATQIRACVIQAAAMADLDIQPVIGRDVRPDDQPLVQNGRAVASAWISSRFWQQRFGGNAAVVGRTFALATTPAGPGEAPVQILGVLPADVSIPLPFSGSDGAPDVWYLLESDLSARPRKSGVFFGLGRLRPGATPDQALGALAVAAQRLGQVYDFDRRKSPVVRPLEFIAHEPARQTMGLLSIGVGLVFLVGCINLAVLMVAEGRNRRLEMALRMALGADRRRLWTEIATEKALLTALSLFGGVVVAYELLRFLTRLVPAAGLGPPLAQVPSMNLAVLSGFGAFALVAAVAWSVFTVAIAVGHESSQSFILASGGPGYIRSSDSSIRAGYWRLGLLATQAGVGICLIAIAGITAKAYVTLSVANLGPSPARTIVFSADTGNVILSSAQNVDFNQQLVTRLDSLPNVENVVLIDRFPPSGVPMSFQRVDQAGVEHDANLPISVTPGYFAMLGIPIISGRSFQESDDALGERVAIISLDIAQQDWSSPAKAINSQITFGTESKTRYTVIGVAANFPGYWSQTPSPTIYLPAKQSEYCCGQVIVRTSSAPGATVAIARQVLGQMPIPATIVNAATIQDRWRATLTRPLARVAGMFMLALLGLGLCVQGVYAVSAGSVAVRRHELAVRAALGARSSELAWDVTRGVMAAVAIGTVLGIGLAFELKPLLVRWLGSTAVWQVGPIAGAVLLLALAALVGCYVPARAAARSNPAEVLRQG